MGRSVSCLSNAEVILYFHFEGGQDEDGEYNENMASMDWDDMFRSLRAEIKANLPSYRECERWDGRETQIFLENNLCVIGISEYCGLVSLSVAVKDSDDIDSFYTYRDNFATVHANAIQKTLEKCIDNLSLTRLNRIGTFSNGESVYRKV